MSTRFQLPPEDLPALAERWQTLASGSGAGAAVIDATFTTLCDKHGVRGRHYHTLGHVRALLDLADEFAAQLTDGAAVRFAIWFHDSIYASRKQDNEEQSALLAIAQLGRLRVPAATVERVAAMIRATKGHDAAGLDDDGRWFLDLDLAILGAAPDVYAEYSKAVRSEYRWVPAMLYRRGRRDVLQGFLRREQLYFTAPLRERFEVQARANLTAELQQLGGEAPGAAEAPPAAPPPASAT